MRRVLAWICLVLVTCTAAYGLQLTSAALIPPAAAADPYQVTSDSVTPAVLIVVVDPVTGSKRAEVECDVPAFTFASDVVQVDGNSWDLSATTQICIDPSAMGSLASNRR
jgi:hypothetical protein